MILKAKSLKIGNNIAVVVNVKDNSKDAIHKKAELTEIIRQAEKMLKSLEV